MSDLSPKLNDQQIRQSIDALKAQGAPRDTIQGFLDKYTKSADGNYVLKSAAAPVNQEDFAAATKEKYGAIVTPKTGQETAIGGAAEGAAIAAANAPSSIFQTAKNIAALPINVGKQVFEAGKGIYETAKEEPEALKYLPGEFLKQLPIQLYEAFVPEAARHLIKGDTEKAAAVLQADPFGQILPFFIAAKEGATRAGMGKAFDAAVSKMAKPTTAPFKAVKGKMVAPFEKSYLPEAAKAFEEQGIKPPVSAITKSPFLQGSEAIASKSAFGRKIFETYTNAKTAIEAKTNAIVERIKPVKTLSEENLGKTVKEGLKEYDDNFKITQNKIYEEFGKKYGSSESKTLNTKETLSEIITEQGRDFFDGVNPKLARMFDRLTGENAQVKAARQQGIPENIIEKMRVEPELSFHELKSTRTSVGEQLARDPENTALKRLYGSLSKDMDLAVKEIDQAGGKVLEKMNVDYKTGKQKIEGQISQSIEKSNPETIVQNLIKRNSADTIRTVKEMIGEERFGEISKTFVRQVFEGSKTRGRFDVGKLKSKLAEYDAETLNEIMSSEQRGVLNEAITQLEKLDKLSQALKPGEKFSGGSQTAFLRDMAIQGGRVGSIVTAIFSGNWKIAAALLFETAVEAGGVKLFTSDIGRKYLTEGLGKTGGETTQPLIYKNILPTDRGKRQGSS